MRRTPRPHATATRTYGRVPADELANVSVELAITPLPTVFVHTRHALSRGRAATVSSTGRPASAPTRWSEAAVSYLRARDRAAFGPLVHPSTIGWPTPLTQIESGGSSMAESLAQIAALPGQAIVDEVLLGMREGVLAADVWAPVLRAPDRWLQSYVEALDRAWRGLEPLWTHALPLLDREVERVSAASSLGACDQLADAVHPYSSIAEDGWRLFERAVPLELSIDCLRMTPLLIDGMCWIESDGSQLHSLAYPLPDAWRALDGLTPPCAALEALLGQVRARLLSRLEGPVTVSRLAEELQTVPSAITYHVRTLETAGLVRRARRGQFVEVERTARGRRLIELYEVG